MSSESFKFNFIDLFPLASITCFEEPLSFLSILTTSAPISDRSIPQNGPGPIPANSITLTPDNGPFFII